jgi:hypothetical protein
MKKKNKSNLINYVITKSQEDQPVSWEAAGLLEGLTPEHKEIVAKYYNQVKLEKLHDNEITETMIYPIIRYTLRQVLDAENVKIPASYLLQDCLINPEYAHKGITKEKVLNEIDVDEIAELLFDYTNKFVPIAIEYLPDLDAEAEMSIMFCKNYLMKIVNKLTK